MSEATPASHSTDSEKVRSDNRQAIASALLPHAHRLVPLVVAMLLATEAILALVVIFSRMNALQQFVCVVLIVVLPTAVLALAVSSIARMLRAPNSSEGLGESVRGRFPTLEGSPWTPNARRIRGSDGSEGTGYPTDEVSDELDRIVEQLEEMSLRARRLPFNIVMGLPEDQLTYVLVKLRATVQSLKLQTEASPTPRGLLEDGSAIFKMNQLERMQDEVRGKAVPALNDDPPAIETVSAPQSAAPLRLPDSLAEARSALRDGDADSAIRGLKDLLLANAEDAEAAELLGVAYERAGDLDSGLEAMRVAVLTEPRRASSHYNYAVLLSKADRLLDAYRQNEVALRLNPEYSAAREFQKLLHTRIVAQQNGAARAASGAESTGVH